VRDAKASIAESTRAGIGRVLLLVAAIFAVALLIAPLANAAQGIAGYIDFPFGSGNGQVQGVRGIAVNANGAGGANPGDVYVGDSSNQRVDEFSAAGDFVRSFGADVVESGPDQADETQSVNVDATGGTFNVSFGGDTTPDLPYTIPASGGVGPTTSLENALNALGSISAGGGSVSVSGGPGGNTPYLVTFDGGPLAGLDQEQLVAADGSTPLTGTVTVGTTNPGATGFEICQQADDDVCKAGASSFEVGGVGGSLSFPTSVAIDQTSGDVYVNSSNGIQKYSATGRFLRGFGTDAVSSGPDDSTVNEVQTVQLGENTENGGYFTLTFNGKATVPIYSEWPGADPGTPGTVDSVEEALDELSTISGLPTPGSVSVSGGPGTGGGTYRITFTGSLAGDNVPQMTADASNLVVGSGSKKATVLTAIGGGDLEICKPDDVCQRTTNFGNNISVAPTGTANAGDVLIGANNRVLEFAGSGAFVRSFGGGVVAGGATGSGTLIAGSRTISSVTTTSKAFAVGQEISAGNGGIPAGTTITAIGAGTITLSDYATVAGSTSLTVAAGSDNTPTNEQQTVTLGPNTTGGTFNLTFSTPNPSNSSQATANIEYDASASAVQSALEALSSIGSGNVSVSGSGGAGGTYTVTFQGTRFEDTDVNQLSSDASGLTVSSGTKQATVATAVQGASGFEICTTVSTAFCQNGVSGSDVGQFSTGPKSVVEDPAGAIFAIDANRAERFTPTGPSLTPSVFGVDETQQLAVDAGAGQFRLALGAAPGGVQGIGDVKQGSTIVTNVQVTNPPGGHFTPGQLIFWQPGGSPFTVWQGEQVRIVSVGPETLTVTDPSIQTESGAAGDGTLFGGLPFTTEDLPYNASPAQVEAALNILPSISYGGIGTGNLLNGSPTINNVQATGGNFNAGQPITAPGGGIPAGTTIVSKTSSSITLSQAATVTGAGIEIASSGGGSVNVSGGVGDPGGHNPYSIAFGGLLAGTDPAQITAEQGTTALSGGAGIATVTTTAQGGPGGRDFNNFRYGSETPLLVDIAPSGHVLIARSYPLLHDTCPDGVASARDVRIQDLSPDGSAVNDVSLPCGGILQPNGNSTQEVNGMATDPTTGYSYVLVAGSIFSKTQRAYLLGPAGPPPTVDLEPPSEITATTVKLTGTVNPNGPGPASIPNIATTTYRVEYKKSSDSDWQEYAADLPIGSGKTSLPFTSGVSQLAPNTEYDVRVVVTKPYGYGPVYATRSFTTLSAPPEVQAASTSNVTAHSVDFNALINPLGSATSYHFDYGPTPSYGQSTAEISIPGTPHSAQHVAVHVEGLEPVVYHYRVVAHNSAGDTFGSDHTFNFYPEPCPNAAVRQQTGSDSLPDCRAYELVSPEDGGTAILSIGGQPPTFASNPTRLAFFGSLGSIPGSGNPTSGDGGDQYVATRTSTGWQTHYVGIPANVSTAGFGSIDVDITAHPAVTGTDALLADRGLNRFLEASGSRIAPYLSDSEGNQLGRLPTDLAEVPGGDTDVARQGATASPDFSHFFFYTRVAQFAPEGQTSGVGSVYDNDVEAGTVAVASKLPGGGPIPGEAGADPDALLAPIKSSTDGSHLLIDAPACNRGITFYACTSPGHLYMRVNQAVTYDVSEGYLVSFAGMTDDGSKVYFTSPDQITDEDNDTSVDLYLWEENNGSPQIKLISQPAGINLGNPGDTDVCNASWTKKCDIEVVPFDDGGQASYHQTQIGPPTDNSMAADTGDIYFYSPEQLDGSNGVPGKRNLYLYRRGQIQYVAVLEPANAIKRIQVSPDGRFAAFLTASRLTSFDNTTSNPNGICEPARFADPETGPRCTEIYRYAAEGDEMICASCSPAGNPPTADVYASLDGLFMSDDGRVFFQVTYPLTSSDTNNDIDIYEYQAGRPQLISSGTAANTIYVPSLEQAVTESGLVGVSADGRDVYFATTDSLVSGDNNGSALRFYDARTNGGFPVAAQVAPCQAADECHGAGNPTPTAPLIASGADLGERGNVHHVHRRRPKHHRRRKKHQKRRRSSNSHGRAAR
jgi:hypothetical protein